MCACVCVVSHCTANDTGVSTVPELADRLADFVGVKLDKWKPDDAFYRAHSDYAVKEGLYTCASRLSIEFWLADDRVSLSLLFSHEVSYQARRITYRSARSRWLETSLRRRASASTSLAPASQSARRSEFRFCCSTLSATSTAAREPRHHDHPHSGQPGGASSSSESTAAHSAFPRRQAAGRCGARSAATDFILLRTGRVPVWMGRQQQQQQQQQCLRCPGAEAKSRRAAGTSSTRLRSFETASAVQQTTGCAEGAAWRWLAAD